MLALSFLLLTHVSNHCYLIVTPAFYHLFSVPSDLCSCESLPISAPFSTQPGLQGPSPTFPFSGLEKYILFLHCQEPHLFMA